MPEVQRERLRLLVQLERVLEWPMAALSLTWVVFAVLELMRGLSPLEQRATTAIWIVFIFEFLLKVLVAPNRIAFLRRNWIVPLSLLLPALRVFRAARVLRLVRMARGAQLAKFLSAMNRGMRALRRTARRHGLVYVIASTVMVVFGSAAALMAFERGGPRAEVFANYPSAIWWTAMVIAGTGAEQWPATPAGRFIAFLVALYSAGVFGYITATLASFFVGEEQEERSRREKQRER